MKIGRYVRLYVVAACVVTAVPAFGIGCGGLLVEVPYAEVYLNGQKAEGWIAFAHPFEGSWLAVSPEEAQAIAFDRSKRTTNKVHTKDIIQVSPNVVDVPTETPVEVLGARPVFTRYTVRARISPDTVLEIRVPR